MDPRSSFSWRFYFKKYKKKSGNILEKSEFWISQLLGIPKFRHFLDLLPPIFFVSYYRSSPQKLRMINRFFCAFWWKNSKSSIILTKWKIISNSQWNQKYFSKSHLWFVWARNVVESWYFWQIRLWNSHGLLVFMISSSLNSLLRLFFCYFLLINIIFG